MLFINWHWITMISISTNEIIKGAIFCHFRHLNENFLWKSVYLMNKLFREESFIYYFKGLFYQGRLHSSHIYANGISMKNGLKQIFIWIIIEIFFSFGNTLRFWKPQVKIDILRRKYPFTVNGHVLLDISQCW